MPCCEICGQFACLHVKKNASIDGNLYVSGASSLQGSNSFGISNFTSDVDVQGVTTLVGDVNAKADISVGGNLSIAGETTLVGNVAAEADLSVSGNVTIAGNLDVTGTILPQQSLFAVKTTAQDVLSPNLNISQAVTWGSVTGNLSNALNISTGVFLAPSTGIYSFTVTVLWNPTENSGVRALGVYNNTGSPLVFREGCVSATSFVTFGSSQSFSGTFAMNEDDSMLVYVRTNVASSLLAELPLMGLEITRVR